MKREDRKISETIKTKLQNFDAGNPLPPELSKETITESLKQQPAPAKKRGNIVEIRRFASFAAALIIVIGSVTAFHLFGGTSGIKLAIENLQGDTSLNPAAGISTARDEEQIIDIFKNLSKDAVETQRTQDLYNAKYSDEKGVDGALAAADESTATNESAQGGGGDGSYGETNVQVKGVDEPDVMKNDGKYLYTVSNESEVDIYSLLPADNISLVSAIKFGESIGRSEYATSLFVKGDLLVVFGNENTYTVYEQTPVQPDETATGATLSESASNVAEPSQGSSPGSSGVDSADPAAAGEAPDAQGKISEPSVDYTRGYYDRSVSVCTVYDISNRAVPKEIKRISQDGSFISARLIGSELYILSSYYVDIYVTGGLEDICIPAVAIDGKNENIPAEDISITKNPEPSYLVVCGVNLDDLNSEPNMKAVLGGGSEAYCTEDSLFVSRAVYTGSVLRRYWGENAAVDTSNNTSSTEIYRFAIGGGKVEFKYSGKVAGQILNQFSMDEYKGYFRIATTHGDWENTSSNVFVLNEKLEVVGKVEKIAPKERIYAVRFMGETGYVVTFEQTDPLFVLDLSDPKAPKIAGELKLPGFSSYLHPITDTLLLGIGQNGNDKGTVQGIKLSLFDVSDPANPKEIDKYIIEGNCYTEAMNTHKAFMFYPEKSLFGIPVTCYNYTTYYDESTSVDSASAKISSSSSASIDSNNNGTTSFFNTYMVKDNKIVPVRNYNPVFEQSGYYTYYGGIYRGTYVDETLYTLSSSALTSFSMETGNVLDTIKISQPIYNYYDYGIKEPMPAD